MPQVRFGLRDTIIKAPLPPTRQDFGALFRGEVKLPSKRLSHICQGVFQSVTGQPEQGEHAGLKVRNRHQQILLHSFSTAPLHLPGAGVQLPGAGLPRLGVSES